MLHLTAFDADDLAALSAQMQDAIIRLADTAWLSKNKRFALVANRFAWDALPERLRRRTGLHINYVTRVRQSPGFPKAADTVLSLLAITFEAGADVEALSGTVMLQFSGGHQLALDVECIDMQLDDLGPAWGTRREPQHDA